MNTLEKIWNLLTPKQRRSAVLLIGLMIVGMILETLGIGLVIPALAAMTQNDLGARYPVIAPALQSLGNPSRETLVVAGMLILVGMYLFKGLFIAFLTWRQTLFAHGVQADLSQRLFSGYLSQPYEFHLRRNSAQLIRNAVTEANIFSQTALLAGLGLIAEFLVVIGILTLLLIVEPVGALLVISVLGAAGWAFYRLTHGRILRWGEARQHHDGLRIQHLQQGLGGAKEVKLLGREQLFLDRYRPHNEGSARVGQRLQTLREMPRLALEFLAVCGLAALVLVMVAQNKPVEALLPTLGLFGAAAFRLMPSVNRMIGAIQNMRYALPVVETLHDEMSLLATKVPPPSGPNLALRNKLELRNIGFHYQSTEKLVLEDISFSIRNGASVGFIGGSGAGKSTLVDIILGLLVPSTGAVLVDGVDIQQNMRGWQNLIGYVPQSIFLTDDTLRRNVAFGLPDEQIDEAAVQRAIRAAQLEEYVSSLPDGLETMVGERGVRLSGGQVQRIGIARALYHDPSVLVLDEATSSLDVATERSVMAAVQALHGHKTVIIVAHRLSTVESCDHLFRLRSGRIVAQGVPSDVLADVTTHD